MLRLLTWLGYATTSIAQFNIVHTQYDTSPPVYPSPNITGAGGWEEALDKARAFVAELMLEEKAGLVTGRLGTLAHSIWPRVRLNVM